MPNEKTDKRGYSTMNPDQERDVAAKGGPTTGLGTADGGHDVSHPYDEDTQTQLAAKSTDTKKSGEFLNDDWKTGVDKDESFDRSSINSDTNSNKNRSSSNYNNSDELMNAERASMNQKKSTDMDNDKHRNK